MEKVNIAIVGATGLVGRMFLKVLEERKFPIDKLTLLASKRSSGSVVEFNNQQYIVEELTEESFSNKQIDIALFSAGGDVSKKYAVIAKNNGVVVIDNSSAWRMDPDVPLVVPEVNPNDAFLHQGIIANPNCSTIQSVVPLKVIHDAYKIKRVIYSTYQAVSGSGQKGIEDLENGIRGLPPKNYPYPIANNCLPQIDVFLDNGYTKEEMKMILETRKILNEANLRITSTTVRVPVKNGHCVSINVEVDKSFDIDEVFELFRNKEGIVLMDDIKNQKYPMPLDVTGHDEVFVGRIRRDESVDNGLNLFVVADNIRKGAAINAVQIAELLLKK